MFQKLLHLNRDNNLKLLLKPPDQSRNHGVILDCNTNLNLIKTCLTKRRPYTSKLDWVWCGPEEAGGGGLLRAVSHPLISDASPFPPRCLSQLLLLLRWPGRKISLSLWLWIEVTWMYASSPSPSSACICPACWMCGWPMHVNVRRRPKRRHLSGRWKNKVRSL